MKEMMAVAQIGNALVVGGGIGGMATCIRLREQGIPVELIDIEPDWRVYGAGITITGPTLRAYKRLGLIDAIKSEGAITNGLMLLEVNLSCNFFQASVDYKAYFEFVHKCLLYAEDVQRNQQQQQQQVHKDK